MTQLQTQIIEDFLARHEVTKWLKLRLVIPGLALSTTRSVLVKELGAAWGVETSIIQRWSNKTATPEESEVLAVLNNTAGSAFHTLQSCLKKPDRILAKWLWEKIMAKVQRAVTGTSAPSDIHSLIKEVFSPIPAGIIQISNECRLYNETITDKPGDQIELGGFVTNTQCNPCVGPDPNYGSGLWGPGP